MNQIYCGDIRDIAKELPAQSVNCIVTSPPYFGLRDYGVDNQIGLEESPEAYVNTLVGIFRELKRVLRDDGSVWLNLGDSYSNGGAQSPGEHRGLASFTEQYDGIRRYSENWATMNGAKKPIKRIASSNLKPKNLIGIPWRVAFALQADGWILRSDIIWHKKNPMPESVTDRPTKAHEYIFLLSKKPRYYYDNEAVREDSKPESYKRYHYAYGGEKAESLTNSGQRNDGFNQWRNPQGRNRRSVWTVSTRPYKAAHFAVFPPDLIRPCILAGCPQQVCGECGEPWERVVEQTSGDTESMNRPKANGQGGYGSSTSTLSLSGNGSEEWAKRGAKVQTTGFEAACDCNADTRPGIVFDPFMGSGTVAQVAIETGRNWLGVELNPEYIELANKRIAQTQPALPMEITL